MARTIIIACCIVMLAIVLLGASGTSTTRQLGSFALHSAIGSSAGGSVALSADEHGTRFASVQAWGLGSLSTIGVGLMQPQCSGIKKLLNPIVADGGGEGTMTAQLPGSAASPIWIALLSTNMANASVLACGHQATPAATSKPQPSPTPPPPIQVPVIHVTQFPTQSPLVPQSLQIGP